MTTYVELDRDAWRGLRANTPLQLTPDEVAELRGLGDPTDIDEVQEVYLPLARLIDLFMARAGGLREAVGEFFGEPVAPTPFIIGIAGSVAVGKSTVARLLRTLLARRPEHPAVELVATDGFLYPNAVLTERGLPTSCRPEPAPHSSCTRTTTTESAESACAESDRRSAAPGAETGPVDFSDLAICLATALEPNDGSERGRSRIFSLA